MSKANTRQVLRHPRGARRLASIHHSISCCVFPSRATCELRAHRQKVFILSTEWNRGLDITLCTDRVECNHGNALPLLEVNDALFKWERDTDHQIYSWRCNAEPRARSWAMAALSQLVAGGTPGHPRPGNRRTRVFAGSCTKSSASSRAAQGNEGNVANSSICFPLPVLQYRQLCSPLSCKLSATRLKCTTMWHLINHINMNWQGPLTMKDFAQNLQALIRSRRSLPIAVGMQCCQETLTEL